MTAETWIQQLGLTPHPEGGYFGETYRAADSVAAAALPARYTADRSLATVIYFLLKGTQVSKFHRLQSDEIWCYQAGSGLTLHILTPDGTLRQQRLGLDIERGELPQTVIEHGQWFGATVNQPQAYTLVSCIVTPGFEFTDFELATRQTLLEAYPQHQAIIERLT